MSGDGLEEHHEPPQRLAHFERVKRSLAGFQKTRAGQRTEERLSKTRGRSMKRIPQQGVKQQGALTA